MCSEVAVSLEVRARCRRLDVESSSLASSAMRAPPTARYKSACCTLSQQDTHSARVSARRHPGRSGWGALASWSRGSVSREDVVAFAAYKRRPPTISCTGGGAAGETAFSTGF